MGSIWSGMIASLPLALIHPVTRSGPGSCEVHRSSVCRAPSRTGPLKLPLFSRSSVLTYTNWSSRTRTVSLAMAAVAIRLRVTEAPAAAADGADPVAGATAVHGEGHEQGAGQGRGGQRHQYGGRAGTGSAEA